MIIKNKILLWFLLPSILVTIVMTVSCFLYIHKVVRGNIFDQLEIAADEMRNNVKIFLSGKQGRTVDFSSDGLKKD